jgi:RnfABCDGE-type electron transport complex B subunit
MDIFIPILTLGALGLIFGVGLAIASKRFAVQIDHRLEEIHGLLPGSNCGACGGAGCFGFAEDILSGKRSLNACRVSEDAVKEKIAHLLGQDFEKQAKKVAVLHCHGGVRVKDKFDYDGAIDCISASQLMQGPKACIYGCIGFGTCVSGCPFGAIKMNKDGLPEVDQYKCTACGKCVAICPKKLFELTALTKLFAVRCKSKDLGRAVMDVCSVGCIACRKCVAACPTSAISIIDNLAVIDYHKCDNRGECLKVCPTGAIAKKEKAGWSNRK